MRFMYHLSFTGHATEEPVFLEKVVPVIPMNDSKRLEEWSNSYEAPDVKPTEQ